MTNAITVFDTTVTPPGSPFVVKSPDANGYFDYLEVAQNYDQILGYWNTAASDDDLWQIQLQMAIPSSEIIVSSTPWYNILVNNVVPTAELDFAHNSTCGKVSVGATLGGTFVATAAYFDAFSLEVTPPLNPVTPSGGFSPVSAGTWSLSTVPCHFLYLISRSIIAILVIASTVRRLVGFVWPQEFRQVLLL